MIPKNVREGAVAEGLDGERASFQIEANGKAFRTLIDGLYSNKIRAVIRELSSNAMDSHIDAGQTRPIEVSIPNRLDPVFRVRDYGTSLSHEDVMSLYTTIFRSTKETSNAVTGQLGLGSKSPFAYTDTFSVIAYKDGQRRIYIAYLETDGVPCITHVSTDPDTESEQGFEVSFPAKREDLAEFQKEMKFVALGYQAGTLKVEGMTVTLPEAIMSGKDWTLYTTNDMGTYNQQNFVRQGTVVYPLPAGQQMGRIGYNHCAVVDIPIGTAEVTASRESLSMDDDTRRAIDLSLKQTEAEIVAQVESEIAKVAGASRRKRAEASTKYGNILPGLRSHTDVSLLDGRSGVRRHGDVLTSAKYYGRAASASRYSYGSRVTSSEHVDNLDGIVVIFDDPTEKIVRRTKRINTFANGRRAGSTFVFADVDPKVRHAAKTWITKCWELKPEQFIKSSDIADCPPPKRAPGSARQTKTLKPGQFWMPRRYSIALSDIYGASERNHYFSQKMVTAAETVGKRSLLDSTQVLFVNEREQIKMEKDGLLPQNRRLDIHIKKLVDAHVKTLPIDEAMTYQLVQEAVGRYNVALSVVLREFFPTLKLSDTQVNDTLRAARTASVDLENLPINAKVSNQVKELAEEYPLLFQRSDPKHYEQYVKAIKLAAKS